MALVSVNFMSKSLMRTVQYLAIIPTDKFSTAGTDSEPSSGKLYKTLYLLHGLFGNCTDWVTKTRIQSWAEERNLAVVMPSGDNAFYVDQPASLNMYGEFIGKELVEATRRMFPLSRERSDTFIGGLSMGGYGAMHNGLKYHRTFGSIVALSSAFHIFEGIDKDHGGGNVAYVESCFGNLREAAKTDKNPTVAARSVVEANKKDPSASFPAIYIACGTDDMLIESNRSFRDYLRELGMDATYYECPGAHNWDFWDMTIKMALDWLPLDAASQGVGSGNVKA